MEVKSLVANGTPSSTHNESMLIIEQFLNDNYLFRRNVLNGKVEFKTVSDASADYRPLTQEALNSIIIRALREGQSKKSEGDVRADECPSRAFSPLYIGLWWLRCEHVRVKMEFV